MRKREARKIYLALSLCQVRASGRLLYSSLVNTWYFLFPGPESHKKKGCNSLVTRVYSSAYDLWVCRYPQLLRNDVPHAARESRPRILPEGTPYPRRVAPLVELDS